MTMLMIFLKTFIYGINLPECIQKVAKGIEPKSVHSAVLMHVRAVWWSKSKEKQSKWEMEQIQLC